MDFDVMEARYITAFVVWLRFRDGTAGEVDLESALRGPMFSPLRDPAYFQAFHIDPTFLTLVWPNGADLAPESLYERVRVHAQ